MCCLGSKSENKPLLSLLLGKGGDRCLKFFQCSSRGRYLGHRNPSGNLVALPISFKGKGDVKGWGFRLLWRTATVALYSVDRGTGFNYEVFRIHIRKAENVFGRSYPDRERYPYSDEFGGNQGWCYGTPGARKRAEAKFREIALG